MSSSSSNNNNTNNSNRIFTSWQTAKQMMLSTFPTKNNTTSKTSLSGNDESSTDKKFDATTSTSSTCTINPSTPQPTTTKAVSDNWKEPSTIQDIEAKLQEMLPSFTFQPNFFTTSADTSTRSDDTFTLLEHCQQLEMWDCGVACLTMINRWLRSSNENENAMIIYPDDSTLLSHEIQEREAILDRIGATSIWTAELVWELHHRQTVYSSPAAATPHHHHHHHHHGHHKYLFCSKTLQVEMEHQDIGYYKSHFTKDQTRVSNVFQLLRQNKASMMCSPEGIPLHLILQATSHPNCVAIVLVDNSILTTTNNTITAAAATTTDKTTTTTTTKNDIEDGHYEGHYNNTITAATATATATTDKTTTATTKNDIEDDHYEGHYVILCGTSRSKMHLQYARAMMCNENEEEEGFRSRKNNYLEEEDPYCLVICNPSPHTPWMYVTPTKFERARKSLGTDEDIIFIVRDK